MKKLFLLSAILLCLVACQTKDEIIKKDKALGTQLDTVKCLTGSVYLMETTHKFLFDRLKSGADTILFGKYSFHLNAFPDDNYLLTNTSGPGRPYSLYISTKNVEASPAGGSLKTMTINKLCSN